MGRRGALKQQEGPCQPVPNRRDTDYAHGMRHTPHAPASEPGSCAEAPAAGLPAGNCSQEQQAPGQGLMERLGSKQYHTTLQAHGAYRSKFCHAGCSSQPNPASP